MILQAVYPLRMQGADQKGQLLLFIKHPIGIENTIPSPRETPNIAHTRFAWDSTLDTINNIH
ncbi:hypothetical protein AMJ86_09080 [bacterium SM23_57]|nr:MAG: hypothetical protein AMJ86_09080 [bacterium SM23_57]